MRIIFANITAALALLSAAMPISASDMEYPLVRIKAFRSYANCLAALQDKHVDARSTEQSSSQETPGGLHIETTHVTGIYYGGAKHASFSILHRTVLEPKPGGSDGHSFGSGIDWSCEGRVMFKGGGHSAYVRIPAVPLPPEPSPIPPPSQPSPAAP